MNVAYPKSSIRLLVLDSLPITFSPLLLEDQFQSSLCVLNDGSLHLDLVRRDDGVSADGILAGPNLVYFVKGEDITNFDVAQAWDGKQISWS